MDKEVKEFLNMKCFSIADLEKLKDSLEKIYIYYGQVRVSRDKWRARYEKLKLQFSDCSY